MRFIAGSILGMLVVLGWLHYHVRLSNTPLTYTPLALGSMLFVFSCVGVAVSVSCGSEIRRSAALGACWGYFATCIAAALFLG